MGYDNLLRDPRKGGYLGGPHQNLQSAAVPQLEIFELVQCNSILAPSLLEECIEFLGATFCRKEVAHRPEHDFIDADPAVEREYLEGLADIELLMLRRLRPSWFSSASGCARCT